MNKCRHLKLFLKTYFGVLLLQRKYRFEGPSFNTIQELIMYQFQSGQPITMKSGAVLKRPIARERWELNNDDVELIEKIGAVSLL